MFSIITGKKVRLRQKFCSPTDRFEPTSKPRKIEKFKIHVLGLELLQCIRYRASSTASAMANRDRNTKNKVTVISNSSIPIE